MLAPGLRSLTIDGSSAVKLTVKNCDALRHFSQLDELALKRVDVKEEGFVSILENLTGLTALEIFHVSMPNATRILDGIFSMSKLKALTFRPTWQTAQQIWTPTYMSQMQLIKLSWKFKTSAFKMLCLTEVTNLYFSFVDHDGQEDLVRLLASMPNLQWLKIKSYDGVPFFPSHLLSRMPRLRGLDLAAVDVDEDIYQTLATLPELIDLTIDFYFAQKLPTSIAFHSQISLLTNLRSLAIRIDDCHEPDGLLDGLLGGNLMRLQKLCVPSPDLRDHRAVLFKRLPSLRRFSQSIAFK